MTLELWKIMAAFSPVTGLLAVAIWRFSRLESSVRHQAKCNRIMVKAVVRLRRDFNRHISREGT